MTCSWWPRSSPSPTCCACPRPGAMCMPRSCAHASCGAPLPSRSWANLSSACTASPGARDGRCYTVYLRPIPTAHCSPLTASCPLPTAHWSLHPRRHRSQEREGLPALLPPPAARGTQRRAWPRVRQQAAPRGGGDPARGDAAQDAHPHDGSLSDGVRRWPRRSDRRLARR